MSTHADAGQIVDEVSAAHESAGDTYVVESKSRPNDPDAEMMQMLQMMDEKLTSNKGDARALKIPQPNAQHEDKTALKYCCFICFITMLLVVGISIVLL